MATEKQIKMCLARAKHAGFALTEEQISPLDNVEINELLDQIAGTKEPAGKTVKTVKTATKSGIVDIRFGLAQKLVAQHYSRYGSKFWSSDTYNSDVHKAYNALEQSEKTYEGS